MKFASRNFARYRLAPLRLASEKLALNRFAFYSSAPCRMAWLTICTSKIGALQIGIGQHAAIERDSFPFLALRFNPLSMQAETLLHLLCRNDDESRSALLKLRIDRRLFGLGHLVGPLPTARKKLWSRRSDIDVN